MESITLEDILSRNEQSRPVIIDMFAEWCGPCKMLAPAFSRVAEKYEDDIDFVKVDVDEQPEIAEHFGVTHIPTLVALKGDKTADTLVGLSDEDTLCAFAQGLL